MLNSIHVNLTVIWQVALNSRIFWRQTWLQAKSRYNLKAEVSLFFEVLNLSLPVLTLPLAGEATLQEAQQFARHGSINATMIYSRNLELQKNRRTS